MQEGYEAYLPDKLEVVLIWIQPVSKLSSGNLVQISLIKWGLSLHSSILDPQDSLECGILVLTQPVEKLMTFYHRFPAQFQLE